MRALALALCATILASAALAATPATLYNLPGGGDGVPPIAGLLDLNGTLYGTTSQGGPNNRGTIFSITP